MTNYAHPEALVDTQWVADHVRDPVVRIIEVHLDPASTNPPLYETGHIPGAVLWNSLTTILQPDFRLNVDKTAVEALLSRSGVANDTTVVIYSDHPAVAPWVLWYLQLFGHNTVCILNGGRKKWLAEGRPLTSDAPVITPTAYKAKDPDPNLRALRHHVQAAVGKAAPVLIDVRTPQEYSGEWFMMGPPTKGERTGHIPGAVHLYYESALNADGTFKTAQELAAVYGSQGVTPDKQAITYCAVGIRSAHTWFVLTHLLGYPHVKSYDGSWNEWGRATDTPIEK
jgi:thiosulfate/3-mercaptopyruvate sulfurtransferase